MADHPRIAALVGQYARDSQVTGFGDHFMFFVGRDDVHGLLLELISGEKNMLKMNMFGYDDEELDAAILKLIQDEDVRCQVTLDKSQASGVHEKKILTADQATLGAQWGNSFTIGQSATHQISHTKGGVLVGQALAFEGSTNWSASGEGTGINLKGKNPTGWKAQNNTLTVSANPVFIARFGAELDVEHTEMLQQQKA